MDADCQAAMRESTDLKQRLQVCDVCVNMPMANARSISAREYGGKTEIVSLSRYRRSRDSSCMRVLGNRDWQVLQDSMTPGSRAVVVSRTTSLATAAPSPVHDSEDFEDEWALQAQKLVAEVGRSWGLTCIL